MRRRISTGGTAILFLLLTSFTVSAAWATEKIDPDRAVMLALQNNGDVKALREERGLHEAGRIKAGMFPNPVLETELSTGTLTGSPSENAYYLGVSQQFPVMGKRGKRLDIAGRDIEIFDSRFDNARRLLREEVKTTFYELFLAGKKAELTDHAVALANQLLEVTRLRLDAGDIPELEVNLARVEVARSEARKAEAERDLYPAKARLLTLLGLPSAESVELFIGSTEEKPKRFNLERLQELALARRPDLKSLESERSRGDAELALARAERIPDVTVGIGYQRQNSSIEVAGSEVTDRDNLIALRISVPIPLFDKNQAAVREAQARSASAETRRVYLRLSIQREVEAAYARLNAAEKTLTIYSKEIIPQLEENLTLVQEAYRLGEVGIVAVIEEHRKFFEVNDGYLTAIYNRQTALAKLEAAVGADLRQESNGGEN